METITILLLVVMVGMPAMLVGVWLLSHLLHRLELMGWDTRSLVVPSCGRCHYPVYGEQWVCPECGSDYREVGIGTPRRLFFGACLRLGAVLIWTGVMASIAVYGGGWLLRDVLPREYLFDRTVAWNVGELDPIRLRFGTEGVAWPRSSYSVRGAIHKGSIVILRSGWPSAEIEIYESDEGLFIERNPVKSWSGNARPRKPDDVQPFSLEAIQHSIKENLEFIGVESDVMMAQITEMILSELSQYSSNVDYKPFYHSVSLERPLPVFQTYSRQMGQPKEPLWRLDLVLGVMWLLIWLMGCWVLLRRRVQVVVQREDGVGE